MDTRFSYGQADAGWLTAIDGSLTSGVWLGASGGFLSDPMWRGPLESGAFPTGVLSCASDSNCANRGPMANLGRVAWRLPLVLAITFPTIVASSATATQRSDEGNWTVSARTSSEARADEVDEQAARVEVWQCVGDAVEPDIVFTGPTYKAWIAYTATQTCTGTFITQQVCTRLQEYNAGTKRWRARTTWRCSQTVAGVFQAANGTVACSDVGKGRYRTRGKGIVTARSGTYTRTATSSAATLC